MTLENHYPLRTQVMLVCGVSFIDIIIGYEFPLAPARNNQESSNESYLALLNNLLLASQQMNNQTTIEASTSSRSRTSESADIIATMTSSNNKSSTNSQFPSASSMLKILYVVVPMVVFLIVITVVGPIEREKSALWTGQIGGFHASVASSTAFSAMADSANITKGPSNVSEANFTVFTPDSEPVMILEEETLNLSKPNESSVSNKESEKPIIKTYSKLEKLEASLSRVRASIREAALVRNLTSVHQDKDYVPRGPMYRNANAFHRSYLEMEKLFKIYVYEEGDPPMFHDGPCKSIYSTEGRFMHEMERGNKYRTMDPDEALVYFLPFSVVMMVQYLYVPGSPSTKAIGRAVVDYVNVVANRHPFWNRSLGADHFMLSCHDWGPRASSYVPHLFSRSIRVLCNANTSEGFNPSKDASFPEVNLKTGEITGRVGGISPSRRTILAFFAGRLHGHIRYLLFEEWKEKDPDVQVHDQLPKGVNYESMLTKSRFCLCPSGYEVASPRVVEAIYAECVPVLISDSYVPPFSDVLNWKSFSVQVQVKDIPNIKKILMGISQTQYLRMHRRVKQVQRHFVVNDLPQRYDVFHMTLHSIWLRRLNIRIQDSSSQG